MLLTDFVFSFSSIDARKEEKGPGPFGSDPFTTFHCGIFSVRDVGL